MAFTAKDVQELREMTGVGMMDCKKALTEADGDMDKAIEWLREKGLAAQTKKAGKVAAEGVSYAIVNEAAWASWSRSTPRPTSWPRTRSSRTSSRTWPTVIAERGPRRCGRALGGLTYPGTDRTMASVTADKVLSIGENIQIRRFVRYAEGVNVPYIHMGGKVGVLVNLAVEGIADMAKVVEVGKDVAMQICAMNPTFLDKSDVDPGRSWTRRRRSCWSEAKERPQDTPASPRRSSRRWSWAAWASIYEENCLLQQAFVKENKISVEKHVAEVAKQLGGKITVKAFTRFQTGEGIEKKEDDFAAEVASMIK